MTDNFTILRRRPRRLSELRRHGSWLHLGDPNVCSECYFRGNFADTDICIIRNAIGEFISTSSNEISPIAFGLTEDEALWLSIAFLHDTEQTPFFPDARVTRAAIRNQFADFGVPWQLAAFRHDIDDVCLEITNRWPASL